MKISGSQDSETWLQYAEHLDFCELINFHPLPLFWLHPAFVLSPCLFLALCKHCHLCTERIFSYLSVLLHIVYLITDYFT